jgi:hypothetical protein
MAKNNALRFSKRKICDLMGIELWDLKNAVKSLDKNTFEALQWKEKGKQYFNTGQVSFLLSALLPHLTTEDIKKKIYPSGMIPK